MLIDRSIKVLRNAVRQQHRLRARAHAIAPGYAPDPGPLTLPERDGGEA